MKPAAILQYLPPRLRGLLDRKFVRDTLILQAGRASIMALSLVTVWVVIRLVGFEGYGVWKLAVALLAVWQTLEMTGIGMSTANRLAIAVGQRDDAEVVRLMAFYVKVTLGWAALTAAILFVFGPLVAARLYEGNSDVGQLAAWYSLTLAADALYTLVVLALRSRRLMRQYVMLQNVNQVALFLAVVGAVVVEPTPWGIVAGRLIYSYSTLILALVVYTRLRRQGSFTFPSLRKIAGSALTSPAGPYWRSGVAMAFDKNLAALFTQVPLTLVGALSGEVAAGYLGTGLDLIHRADLVTGPVLENMQAVVPMSVGKGDFAALRRNFARVLLVMTAAGIGFYTLIALFAPLAITLLFGEAALPAVPVTMILAVYGAIVAVGGIFGPLYRALGLMRSALAAKIIAALVMLPLGYILIQNLGPVGGAWTVVGVVGLSVALTAGATLPHLNRAAEAKQGI